MNTVSLEDPVSRYLNQPISLPLARRLVRTFVTPSQVSIASFLVALGTLASFAAGQPIVAGISIQLSSVVTSLASELVRLRGTVNRFDAVLNGLTERYADAAIAGGMTWWAWTHPELSGPQPLVVGLGAITAFLIAGYSQPRLENEGYTGTFGGIWLLASRDTRLLLLALGSVAGQTYWTLVFTGSAACLAVGWSLWRAYRQPADAASESLPEA